MNNQNYNFPDNQANTSQNLSANMDNGQYYVNKQNEEIPDVTSPTSLDDLLNPNSQYDAKFDSLLEDDKLDMINEGSQSMPNLPNGLWNSDYAISSDFFASEPEKPAEEATSFDNDAVTALKNRSTNTTNTYTNPVGRDQYSNYNSIPAASSAPLNGFAYHSKYSSIPTILAPKNQSSFSNGYNMAAQEETEEDEKRQQKLARNRESARQSRRRKKQYQELLDDKINDVVTELASARKKHLEKSNDYFSNQLHRYMDTLKNSPNQTDHPTFIQFQQLISPNNNETRERDGYIFSELQNLALPFYTKFMFWMFNRNGTFFSRGQEYLGRLAGSPQEQNNNGPIEPPNMVGAGSLWPQFIYFLNLSAEQEQRLRLHCLQPNILSSKLHNPENNIKDCTQSQNLSKDLGVFSNSIRELSASIYDSMNNILSPSQQLKLYQLLEESDFSYVDVQTILTSAMNQLPSKEEQLKINKDFEKQFENLSKTSVPTFYDISNLISI